MQYAIHRVHSTETVLTRDLLRIADRHPAEHEVHHVAWDLAGWSGTHVRLIAQHGSRHGLDLAMDVDREKVDAVSAPVALLEDLAELYLRAADASLGWEMLGQIAQAQRERELLALTTDCHPQTLRQIRWANTMLKTVSPQTLSSM
jgi:hypothetical protein